MELEDTLLVLVEVALCGGGNNIAPPTAVFVNSVRKFVKSLQEKENHDFVIVQFPNTYSSGPNKHAHTPIYSQKKISTTCVFHLIRFEKFPQTYIFTYKR